jgi:hypothetical protein
MKINACFLLVKNTTKYLIAGNLLKYSFDPHVRKHFYQKEKMKDFTFHCYWVMIYGLKICWHIKDSCFGHTSHTRWNK